MTDFVEVARERLLALLRSLPGRARAWWRNRLRPRLQGLPTEVWQHLTAHRMRTLAGALLFVAAALAGIRTVPPIYGRYALAHAAGIAARQSRLKGEAQVVLELRHRAFELGLTEAAMEPEVFHLEAVLNDEGPCCRVTYDFVHVVHVLGRFRWPMRIQGDVTRLQVDPMPSPLDKEEP